MAKKTTNRFFHLVCTPQAPLLDKVAAVINAIHAALEQDWTPDL